MDPLGLSTSGMRFLSQALAMIPEQKRIPQQEAGAADDEQDDRELLHRIISEMMASR
jgi:hypothetical protein